MFTLPIGYSRPPSAVNDPTVTKQVNSENHASNKCPNHFFIRFLINRCWVRLGMEMDSHGGLEVTIRQTESKKKTTQQLRETDPECS